MNQNPIHPSNGFYRVFFIYYLRENVYLKCFYKNLKP